MIAARQMYCRLSRTARDRAQQCLLISLVLLLAACSGADTSDIEQFMRDVENKPRVGIQPLPVFKPYQPFTYGAANQRSPFEPPIIIPPKTREQLVYSNLRPPQNHVKQFLERYAIGSLKMVGSLEQDNETWALVEDGDGGVHRVEIGDFLGSDYGEVKSIDETSITLSEIVSDGASGWLPRPRIIQIRSKAE